MILEQLTWSADTSWTPADPSARAPAAQLVLAFGDRASLGEGEYLAGLQSRFPHAAIVSCSSGGSIRGRTLTDEGVVATAIEFESCTVQAVETELALSAESEAAGARLGRLLPAAGLRHVLVFAEGLHVNGSALARGLTAALPAGVSVTGGLAADGDRFQRTIVGLDGRGESGRAVAVGIYGEALEIGTGSFGGWEAIEVDYRITRSEGNVLYELDGRPALHVYKELLGPMGYALPAAGLFFPLKIRESVTGDGVVRTILGVDANGGSVTFAGDIPQGWSARLVRTNLDRLIGAAGVAAGQSAAGLSSHRGATLGLAVSCIGRKLLLQQRVGEELAKVCGALGPRVTLAGFYSYGELAPSTGMRDCELHNQTMTVTAFTERI